MTCIRNGFWLLLGLSAAALGGQTDVLSVIVDCDPSRKCSFNVTVSHADAGWEHYADHFRVLGPEGKELGRRVLYHPHVTEQPFTRSLEGVLIPAEIGEVTVEAHDSVHEYGGRKISVILP